jgi:hypothetical protein
MKYNVINKINLPSGVISGFCLISINFTNVPGNMPSGYPFSAL